MCVMQRKSRHHIVVADRLLFSDTLLISTRIHFADILLHNNFSSNMLLINLIKNFLIKQQIKNI